MAPTLQTPRLILREWTGADIEAWADIMSDPDVMRYQPALRDRDAARESARRMAANLRRKPYGKYVLERKANLGFAGMMALDDIWYDVPFTPTREIGWFLVRSAWGQGYATEAAQALLRYAFDELQWPEVVAMTATINTPSRRVMERLRMTHNPADDFDHPLIADDSILKRHVLYRIRANQS